MRKKYPKFNLAKLSGVGKNFEFEYVYKHRSEFIKICDEAEKNSSKIVNDALKKYIIIKLVTLLENSYKKIINEEINRYKIDLRGFFDKEEISIPLSAIDLIKGAEVTKGDIVASNFNFQNSRDINFVLSTATGLNFFETLREIINLPLDNDVAEKSDWNETRKEISENWNDIFNVFKIRNDLVHKDLTDVKIENKKLRQIVDATCNLINFSAYCIQIFIEIKNADPREELEKESKIAFGNKAQTIIDIVKKRNADYKQKFSHQNK